MPTAYPTQWLIVENDDDEFMLLRRAVGQLPSQLELVSVKDGVEAKAYLSGTGAYGIRGDFHPPALIISDLKMPKCDGLELLAWVKEQRQWATLPFVVLTNSNSPRDRQKAEELGAACYLVKPGSLQELRCLVEDLFRRFHKTELPLP